MNRYLLLFLFCAACRSADHPVTLTGKWNAETIELQSGNKREADEQTFQMKKYGSGSISLMPDSSFILTLHIDRDVIATRNVMGVDQRYTVIPAVYDRFERGHYLTQQSNLTLYDAKGSILAAGKYSLEGATMGLTIRDKKNHVWTSTFSKQ